MAYTVLNGKILLMEGKGVFSEVKDSCLSRLAREEHQLIFTEYHLMV